MYVEKIHLKNFRNIRSAEVGPFSDGINMFVGENGSGKTNLLEAIGFGSIAKSCRGAPSAELINLNGETVSAQLEIEGFSQKKNAALDIP